MSAKIKLRRFAPLGLARLLFPLSLLLCSASCGGEPSTQDSKAPLARLVIWIEVDTLRADALGCYGAGLLGEGAGSPTPHLDGLAEQGLRFDAAYSTAPWTLPSLASALTGKWPWEHGTTRLLSSLAEGHVTMAERLASHGFRTGGVMTNFVATEAYGFAQGFELWDDSLAQGHVGSSAAAAAQIMLDQYDSLSESGDPIFLFGLFFEPHWVYEPSEDPAYGTSQGSRVAATEDIWELRSLAAKGALTDADLSDLVALYAGEVAKVDAAIGQLIEGLKQRGAWDDALVLFTADHGELLGERDWIGHTVNLADELVRVPMILRIPTADGLLGAGTSFPTPVSQVDLHSTLLELAGVEPQGELNITSRSFAQQLFNEGAMPAREDLFLHVDFEPHSAAKNARSKRTLQWGVVKASDGTKWTVDHLAAGGPAGKLVDPNVDPEESHDLTGELSMQELREYWRLGGLVPEPLKGKPGELPR
jgi:arylsulfatase A-like enzyme